MSGQPPWDSLLPKRVGCKMLTVFNRAFKPRGLQRKLVGWCVEKAMRLSKIDWENTRHIHPRRLR